MSVTRCTVTRWQWSSPLSGAALSFWHRGEGGERTGHQANSTVRSHGAHATIAVSVANPIAVRLSGANVNRDTVSNVAKGGLALDNVESRGFGIIKLIRASAGERASDHEEN